LCQTTPACDRTQLEVLIKKDKVFEIMDIRDVNETIDGINMTIKEIVMNEL